MLIALLWIHLVVTLFGGTIPVLFLPHALLVRYRLPVAEPVLFLRLMGAAFLGLSTMYAFGLARAYRGEDATDVMVIGIVTDGMASAIIWRYALGGMLDQWPSPTRSILYAAAAGLTALSLGLLAAGFHYGG